MGDSGEVDAFPAVSVWAELRLIIVLSREVLVHVSAGGLNQLVRHTVIRLQLTVRRLDFEEIDATLTSYGA